MGISLNLIETVLQAIVAGVLVGCIYALMCVGLGLIFGMMRVINFAQGEFLMLGMYIAMYAFGGLKLMEWFGPYFGTVIAAFLAGAVLFVTGVLLHRYLLARVTGTRAAGSASDGHFPQLILTLGLSLIFSNAGLIVFGSTPQSIQTSLTSSAWEIGPLVGEQLSLFINKARLLASVVSALIAAALFMFVNRSRVGKTLRAAADNPDAATYMGIRVDRAHSIAFGLGCAVTGVAGGMLATYYPFQPYIGGEFVTVMYAGVVLGGLGSIVGAFWGGLTIGLIQQLSTLVLPLQLQNAAMFIVFLLIILLRPQGLFGRNVERT